MGKVEIGIYFCVTADILTKVLLKCFWSSPLPAIRILSKSLILMVATATEWLDLKKKKKYSKTFFLEAIRGMKLKLCINASDISLYINYVFYCCCSCVFIAITTSSFHRFIMGKVKLGLYF